MSCERGEDYFFCSFSLRFEILCLHLNCLVWSLNEINFYLYIQYIYVYIYIYIYIYICI